MTGNNPQPDGEVRLSEAVRSLRSASDASYQNLPSLVHQDGSSMKILQVVPAMQTGGVERGTIDIARAIVAAGGRALVASSGGAMEPRLRQVGAEHITLPLRSKNPCVIWRNAVRLQRLIETRAVDLIHARSRAPAWLAILTAHRTGKAFVTTVHAPYSIQNRAKSWYNSVMTRGDAVISISHFVSDYINRHYVVDPDKITVVHRGIDVDAFNPDNVSAERVIQLANRWRVPDGAPLIMLPGRLTRWKGQRFFLDALQEIKHLNFCCVFVGSDQGRKAYSKELKDSIRDYGLGDKVFMTDNCDDMPAAYMLADVVAAPSTNPEGFGRVISEGQAMGCPIVASDHGGASEQILPNETGFLFPNLDVSACARALETALSLTEEQRNEFYVKGRKRVQEHFSKAQMNHKTLEIYRRMILGRCVKA